MKSYEDKMWGPEVLLPNARGCGFVTYQDLIMIEILYIALLEDVRNA
jgi:hypothetical protein